MKAAIQNQISPPPIVNTQSMSDAKIKKESDAKDSTGPKEKVDFKSVLFNSNVNTKKEREAKANGDLTADSHEEFLEKLAEQTKQERTPKNHLDKDDFLKLFVTQLQHQDPLNPDDGAEMAAKLAQFNSLEQLMNVNTSLEKMSKAGEGQRNMMLSSFIGKEMQVSGGRTKLENDKLTESNFDLARGAKNVTLQVRDTNGLLIAEKELGSLQPGNHKLQWDGRNRQGERAPDGIYTFSIMALDPEGKDIPVEIASKVRILGVDINDQAGSFFTDYGKVSLDKVKSVGEHGFYNYKYDSVKDNVKTEQDMDTTQETPLSAIDSSADASATKPLAEEGVTTPSTPEETEKAGATAEASIAPLVSKRPPTVPRANAEAQTSVSDS